LRPSLAALATLGLAVTACSLVDRVVPGYRIRPGTAERPAITSFEIQGTQAVSQGDLKSRLVTQASDGVFAGYLLWRETRYFDEDAFANDRRRILRYYQAQGYYSAKVASYDVKPDGQGKVKVLVRVDEGKPTRVTSLDIDGMDAAPEARQRLGKLPLKKGDVFTEAAYDATRAAILMALVDNGWAKAEVAQEAQVDPALAEARVRYTVTAGARYRFGNVFVAGAAAVPRARIRDQAELATKPGQTFDESELAKAQSRVYDLGVFGGVRVTKGPPDEAKKTIPLVVSVREAPFRTIRVGPGFTFQSTRWEADVMAGWTHRNWLGGLRKLQLDARAGYTWLGNPFSASQKGPVGLASADFLQPGVLTREIDLNVHGELERGLEPAYNFFAERVRLGTPIRFGRLFTIIPSVNFELYQLSGQPSVTAVNAGTGNVLLLQTCPRQNPDLCLVSYFEQRFTLDLRDDVINTRKGVFLSLSVQEGFRAVGVGSAYLRLLPELRAFAPLPFLGMVLAGRARVGLVDPSRGTQDVPIVAKFTSGGPNLMRGYYTRSLSPVLFVPDPIQGCGKGRTHEVPVEGGGTVTQCRDGVYLPVGGNGLLDGSLELRIPLGGNWLGAAFLDFGDVRLSSKEALNVANLQYAAGLGIRYNTLFGPVRIDIASRLPTARTGDHWPGVQIVAAPKGSQVLVPTGDIHHDPIVSVHLSIGEAF
jgi:translocation and assembly module TamA